MANHDIYLDIFDGIFSMCSRLFPCDFKTFASDYWIPRYSSSMIEKSKFVISLSNNESLMLKLPV